MGMIVRNETVDGVVVIEIERIQVHVWSAWPGVVFSLRHRHS
jgi:hypothetical protein